MLYNTIICVNYRVIAHPTWQRQAYRINSAADTVAIVKVEAAIVVLTVMTTEAEDG